MITDLDPDSPAEKAGLRRSDVIVAINKHPVSTREELRLLVSQIVPESKAALTIIRDGKERTVNVTIGRVIDNPNELLAGVDVMPLTPEVRRRLRIQDTRVTGLVVTSVADDSPYREQLAPSMVTSN